MKVLKHFVEYKIATIHHDLLEVKDEFSALEGLGKENWVLSAVIEHESITRYYFHRQMVEYID